MLLLSRFGSGSSRASGLLKGKAWGLVISVFPEPSLIPWGFMHNEVNETKRK